MSADAPQALEEARVGKCASEVVEPGEDLAADESAPEQAGPGGVAERHHEHRHEDDEERKHEEVWGE